MEEDRVENREGDSEGHSEGERQKITVRGQTMNKENEGNISNRERDCD